MAGLVERLVAQKLWELFRRMVPPTEMVRQQGGGKKRVADDREVLAGIVFVATSGLHVAPTAACAHAHPR
ncbi:hypothetical protein [Streptomyces griseofuscus]|uniref:hypothetical protein n=1 Tax=Streptomyces griseofuscus TaxID=146922 RepID=UPI003F4CE43A